MRDYVLNYKLVPRYRCNNTCHIYCNTNLIALIRNNFFGYYKALKDVSININFTGTTSHASTIIMNVFCKLITHIPNAERYLISTSKRFAMLLALVQTEGGMAVQRKIIVIPEGRNYILSQTGCRTIAVAAVAATFVLTSVELI